MDGTRKQCEVEFANVKVSAGDIVGELNNGWTPLRNVISRASACLRAENTDRVFLYMALTGTPAEYDDLHGSDDNNDIQKYRHVLYVEQVIVEFFRGILH